MSTAPRPEPPAERACGGDHPSGVSPLAARIRQEIARAQLRMDASMLRSDRAIAGEDGSELRAALDEQRRVVAETEARLAAVVRQAVDRRDAGPG